MAAEREIRLAAGIHKRWILQGIGWSAEIPKLMAAQQNRRSVRHLRASACICGHLRAICGYNQAGSTVGGVMRTRIFWLAAVCALVLTLPAPSFAQAKVRIAVWEFDNNAEHSWWFYDKLGPAARNQIDNACGNDQALSTKFSMIERAKLDRVMKEQGLGAAGALDPQSAAKIGRVLGIKYIVTGGIDKFAINNTRGGIGALGV